MSEAVDRLAKRDLGRAFRWLPCSRCGATSSRRDEYDDGSVLCRNRDACDARAGLTSKPTAAEKAAALELGLAWRAAEAALPEGNEHPAPIAITLLGWRGRRYAVHTWISSSIHGEARKALLPWRCRGTGSTPAEALRNLAAKLAEANP